MGAIYGNSYYTIVDGPSWIAAETNAVSLGGNLASIESSAENQFISSSFKDENKSYYAGSSDKDIYWIGLTKQSGAWEWSNGSSFNYSNWGPLEPYEDSGVNDRAEMTVEAHGGPWLQSAGNWNNNSDIISPLGRYGIAEIPLSYFSISDASIREGENSNITITRTGHISTTQTLRVQTSDGSATLSNDDYAQINKTVTFAAGETSKTISVSTTADLDVEDDETFTLTITAEGKDDVPPQISDGRATVSIKADDFKRSNSLYTVVDGPTWEEAEANAVALSGHLVTINDQEENDWLVDNLKDLDVIKDDSRYINHTDIYSIGLTRDSAQDAWKWASGEEVNFTNFGPQEPYNRQKYAAMNTFNNAQTSLSPKWNWGSVSGSWVDGYADGISPITFDGLYEL